MAEFVEQNLVYLIAILVIVLLLVGWHLLSSRRTRVEFRRDDDGGTRSARRNQTLIDAPPVAPMRPVRPDHEQAQASSGPAAARLDDLTRIKGVGPKLQQRLHDLGVTSFAQIAAWDDAEVERIDAQLGRFQGRIVRDDWRTQASLLDAGDLATYEARFGSLLN